MTKRQFESVLEDKFTRVFVNMLNEVPFEYKGTPLEALFVKREFLDFTKDVSRQYCSMREITRVFTEKEIQQSIDKVKILVAKKFTKH